MTLVPMQESVKRKPTNALNSGNDKVIKEQIKNKSRGVKLNEETHRVTPTKELQDYFEDKMEEIGFVLDD